MPQKCLRKYGQAATIVFTLFETDGVNFKIDASFASGDVTVMKDEGAEANTTNLPTDKGKGYSLVLTATEMEAARVIVYLVDQGTKTWLDDYLVIETYGHANAEHAFDLDSASVTVGTNNDKTGYALTSAYDPAKTAAQEGDAMTLTAAYDAAKTAASQSSVNAIPTNPLLTNDARLDNLDATISSRLAAAGYTAPDNAGIGAAQAAAEAAEAILEELTEDDGGGNLRYTEKALEQAPSGSGVGDWTSGEKEQIRYRLQLDGTQTAPAADAPLQMPVSADAIYQDSFTAEGLYKVFNIAGEGIQANVMKWRGGTPAILEGQFIKTHVIEFNDDAKLEIENTIFDALLSGHTTAGTAGERLGRIPNAAAGGNGGLPTVDASNYIAGIQGTKNQLDDLNDLTQQQVRDAMKLAPTAGEPAAGSIDTHLDTIETDAGNAADNVGTAISLDSGAATLAGMLTKIADDNGGADFDAGTGSLNEIALNGVGGSLTAQQVRDAMKLAPSAGEPAAGSVDTHLDTIETDAGAAADALATDTLAEMSAGAPPATPTIKQALMYLYMALRNASSSIKTGENTGTRQIKNDAGTTIAQGNVSDDGTTFTQGKLGAP